jgi:hypothetical protein
MNYSVVHLNKMVYENHEVVRVDFSYSEELVKSIRQLPGARWNNFYRTWIIEKRAGLLNEVMNCFKGKAYLDYRSLKNEPMLSAAPGLTKIMQETPEKIEAGRLNKKQAAKAKQYALFI